MIAVSLGLLLGIVVGTLLPWSLPIVYAPYISVAIMACLDAVFGGARAGLEGKYDSDVFFSGVVVNTLVAGLFVFIGKRLGIDIYYVALLSFGLRIFNNTAVIRRIWLEGRKKSIPR
ncbi:MAG: small basic family protein [Veillonellaceae bacterium]|nr:small basic family protein [Veillonellaceae bacterium]